MTEWYRSHGRTLGRPEGGRLVRQHDVVDGGLVGDREQDSRAIGHGHLSSSNAYGLSGTLWSSIPFLFHAK